MEDHYGFELTWEQREGLRKHCSTCHEAQKQVGDIAHTIERMAAAVINAASQGQSVEELVQDRMLQLLSIERRL